MPLPPAEGGAQGLPLQRGPGPSHLQRVVPQGLTLQRGPGPSHLQRVVPQGLTLQRGPGPSHLQRVVPQGLTLQRGPGSSQVQGVVPRGDAPHTKGAGWGQSTDTSHLLGHRDSRGDPHPLGLVCPTGRRCAGPSHL
ncbi:hypothetical protein HJG60_011956 [Phyllostomus discolor]|uniref:Uncharacterized protein n=1 Tax=Phyllostomus discolor TaxID=89673 RepID=A0A833ZLG7_9CHIR|nr:hypothetical protein HJG60_011956 [Phyllostomus discolor]